MKQSISYCGLFFNVLFTLLFLSGCGEPASEKSPVPIDPTAGLSDEKPVAGSCVGWQKSLATGHRLYDVQICLSKKALTDRPSAVAEAKQLMKWKIKEDSFSELSPLIAALSQYPEPNSLKNYLSSNALLPNKAGEYSYLDKALTASDYLKELGNIHWFDAETGDSLISIIIYWIR